MTSVRGTGLNRWNHDRVICRPVRIESVSDPLSIPHRFARDYANSTEIRLSGLKLFSGQLPAFSAIVVANSWPTGLARADTERRAERTPDGRSDGRSGGRSGGRRRGVRGEFLTFAESSGIRLDPEKSLRLSFAHR